MARAGVILPGWKRNQTCHHIGRQKKIVCSTDATHMKWEWRFMGPKDTEIEAMEVIESFLEGFRWWYEDEEPPKEED